MYMQHCQSTTIVFPHGYADERPSLSIAGQTVLRNELIHCPVDPSDPSIMGLNFHAKMNAISRISVEFV